MYVFYPEIPSLYHLNYMLALTCDMRHTALIHDTELPPPWTETVV